MALNTLEGSKQENLKPIRISRDKALEMQRKLIADWTPQSDVWAFRYGSLLLAAGSVFSSAYTMGHYRRKLKLLTYGRPLMVVPGVIVPAMMIPLLYERLVGDAIVLGDACPVCIQLRGVVLQLSLSVAYPMLVNSLGGITLANAYATYRLPTLSRNNLGELWGIWRKMTKPLQAVLPYHLLGQLLLAFVMTELQAKQFFSVQEKMIRTMDSS